MCEVKKIEMGGACNTCREEERCIQGFDGEVRTPEGRRPCASPKCRWEGNIKMYFREVGWVAWTGLIWFRKGTGGRFL